jgi:hypothetical protein
MKVIEINDRYNPLKVWVVKVTKCNHYYVNQKINGRMFYKRFSKTTKRQLENAILFDFDRAMKIEGGAKKWWS